MINKKKFFFYILKKGFDPETNLVFKKTFWLSRSCANARKNK